MKKIIIYLRKSREEQINGYGSIEFTLERHEEILQTWAVNNLGGKIPEENIFREVGSGETISDRPVMLNVLKMTKNNEISGILVIEPQRLSRGDLKDCGELIETLEAEIEDINNKMLDPKLSADFTKLAELSRESESKGEELSQLMDEWAELQEEIESKGYEI